MSGPSDRRFDLNLGEEAAPPSPDNIWRQSFISPTGPLTVEDLVMKNDMTAAVVVRNLVIPKDNKLLAKRSDELAVKDSLAFSSVSNMAQRLFARTYQVESLAAERFVGLFQQHLPSSSGAVPRNEPSNDQPLMPPPSGASPTAETSSKQPLCRLPLVQRVNVAKKCIWSILENFLGMEWIPYAWSKRNG
ncbi:unnamed protein product [Malus baccata var. baccata]